ncbi:MAG TPA: outer membrane beta-barrel protein, partial [Bacteroidales bacterium]|nr:outer membrane beta-barrel protein [Bacteroidales bacterium]
MHSLRYPFIVCILFINNILVFSQQIKTESQFYQLKAIVADSLTGLPIPFGSVTLLSQPGNKFVKGTTADENGEFSFFNLASANYSIRFNSIGYNEKHYNLNFKDTNNLNQKFVLTPTQIELNDVVVQAHKPLYRQEADKKVYLVSNDPIIQSSFGLDALQNAPGVDVDLSGAISLRGTSVAIFINGQQTNKTGELLKTYLEQLPASSIERIEIISNPSAKYTATNANGVINIILKKNSSINQLFCLGAVVSNRPTYGLWSSYVFTKPKWNLNLRYLVSSTSDHQEDLKESKSALNDYNFHSLFNQTIQNQNINQNIDADFDYKFSAKSSLTMSSGAFWSNGDNRLENSLYREFENSDSVATFNSNKEKFSFIYNNFTFNRTFNTEGHTLSISIFNEIFETNSTKLRDQRSLYSDKNQIRYTSECLSNSSQSLKIDYSLPFTKDYGMEVGFLYNPFVKTKDYRQVDTLSNNGGVRYRCDLLHKSNSTQVPKFESYLTLNGSFLKLQYKVGIRFETSNVNIKNAAPTFSMNRKFIGAYPSIHFSYETSGKHNFSISYSSRIVKPYDEMIP